jgi:hypothetical protein
MSNFDPLQMDERLGAAQRGVPNPVALSRQVAAADAAYHQWRERLRDDPECEDDPLQAHRAVAGRTLFRDLEQLGEHDPLRVYLKRWVWCLAERRVNAGVLRRLSFERHHLQVSMPKETTTTSPGALLLGALREPSGAASRLEHYLRHSHSFARLNTLLWERRGELARRWGLVGYEPMIAAEPSATADSVLVRTARAWLDRTQDMATEHRRDSAAAWLDLALARDAQLEWPGRLNWRTLCEWFAEGDLLAGLRLGSKRLPERMAPASFLRGLARLGAEWSQALAPTDQFFVVAHDPFRVRVHSHAALFAGLLLNPSFLKRHLHADSVRLRAAQRPLWRAVLLESRARAFKIVMANAAQQGWPVLQETFLAEVVQRFGFALPPPAAGALLLSYEDSVAPLPAMMLAVIQAETLASSHDEDWFRNPRAIDQLRSEAVLPPPLTVDPGVLDRGGDALYGRLAAALG